MWNREQRWMVINQGRKQQQKKKVKDSLSSKENLMRRKRRKIENDRKIKEKMKIQH